MPESLIDHIRRHTAYVRWAAGRVGYWVRPYDMLADRRRWFWQPAQRCGGPALPRLLVLCDCPFHPCAHNPEADHA